MADNMFSGEMDPELAALIGTAGSPNGLPPDFSDIFSDNPGGKSEKSADKTSTANDQGVDLSVSGFPHITRRFEETPHNYFSDPAYYKTALSNEGDIAQRVHGILQKFLTAKDPKDRSVFRQQFISPFWEFLLNVARKSVGKLPPPKRFLLRFAILHPTFINEESRNVFAKVIVENELNQPVYYLDEWLKAVGTSMIRPSTTDEVKISKNNQQAKIQQLMEKALGKLDGARVMLKAKDKERHEIENVLRARFESIFERTPLQELSDVSDCYTEMQKVTFNEIQSSLKDLLKNDHDLDLAIKDYVRAEADVQTLSNKLEAEGSVAQVDMGALDTEFETVRQMAKMSIGRQGNHFPLLIGDYFHSGPNEIGIRENIITMLAKIESIDAEAFCRVYKNRLNRIVPFVLLIPTYGDYGFCWEPFDRYNRATSRGRIVIPMYPKNLYMAVLTAVADLRWQVAKEKASFYWMEEGITGNYYNWFQSQKLKGDIKEFFIQDYILWMTKESEGIQKLDKELRGAFWRYMPFTREVKEKLKTRSFVYQELCQRDVNRSLSDGY
ncbi:MAG: hypothetical protein LBB81_05640 [Treponema sp.]|jgi:hypothetical protein|nr:hypothetical protein [Treponema sp.]